MTRATEIRAGYLYGRVLDNTRPRNRSPYFLHGFRNGREDAELMSGLRDLPVRTGAQAAADLAMIDAMLGKECV